MKDAIQRRSAGRRFLDFLDALEARPEPTPGLSKEEKRALVRFFGVGLIWLAVILGIIVWRMFQ